MSWVEGLLLRVGSFCLGGAGAGGALPRAGQSTDPALKSGHVSDWWGSPGHREAAWEGRLEVLTPSSSRDLHLKSLWLEMSPPEDAGAPAVHCVASGVKVEDPGRWVAGWLLFVLHEGSLGLGVHRVHDT